MSGVIKINDGLVKEIHLFTRLKWYLRWDVFPFGILYPILFAIALNDDKDVKWSVGVKCILGHKRVQNVESAQYLHVIASKNAGKDRVVKLWTRGENNLNGEIVVAGARYSLASIGFEFQKVVYSYNSDKKTFHRLEYPSSGPVADYLKSNGHLKAADLNSAYSRWGANEFDIPIPSFASLYAEHMVAPFFVFQVLCLLLWSLDEYWYYSFVTLIMLMIFEGMVCKQRQGSLSMLREMRRPPIRLFVLRSNQWELLSSDQLVPGDLISLSSDAAATIAASKGVASTRKPVRRDAEGMLPAASEERVVPCDALLLRGSCVVNEAMLTGESVPQVKETLENADDRTATIHLGEGEDNVDAIWRRHLVFAGTTLLQHTDSINPPSEAPSTGSMGVPAKYPRPPDRGCVAVVARTGFATSQGGLMRKILYATERVTANSMETFQFIGILVVFAVIASGTVLEAGLRDDTRNRFKLILHCIMIVTSVVPPELPMELSLAVTNSLQALSRELVFCTEPFRIPFAGRLTMLCFDKTGTLTQDHMYLRGVCATQTEKEYNLFQSSSPVGGNPIVVTDKIVGEKPQGEVEVVPVSLKPKAITAVDEPEDMTDLVLGVMGSCHSLFQNSGQIQGDPMELATMESTGFAFESSAIVTHKKRNIRIRIHHKYPFSSALKRMSVLVEAERLVKPAGTQSISDNEVYVFTKGAPEILVDMLVSVPPYYTATYMYHMSKGRRVIAIAFRRLTSPPVSSSNDGLGAPGITQSAPLVLADARSWSRSEVEKQLVFLGFLVFDCDLKPDSKSVVKELRQAEQNIIMITGDSAFTAAEVGRKLGITKADGVLILQLSGDKDNTSDNRQQTKPNLEWVAVAAASKSSAPSADTTQPFSESTVGSLALKYSLCVTGPALVEIEKTSNSIHLLELLRKLCPHISIYARVSPAQKEHILRALNEAGQFTLMCGDGTNDVGALKAAHVGVSIVNDPELERRVSNREKLGNTGDKKVKVSATKSRMNRAMAELEEQERDPTIVRLGDASIASPFTARRTSIDCILAVLRQGRCTLVTTIQVFKILALNCLVSAYMMSALYLKGLKQGDIQMTATGLATAGLFFFLSQAKPLLKLSHKKPPSSVFARSVLLSIIGQFLVHLASLVGVLYLCEHFAPTSRLSGSPDGRFRPNLVNSAVYILSSVIQITNFIVNYRGHPFTQSIQENTMLWRSVIAVYAVIFIACTEVLEPLNDLLQLAPFPNQEFRSCLISLLAGNFGAAYLIEKFCQRFE